jgi:hypothetical protein
MKRLLVLSAFIASSVVGSIATALPASAAADIFVRLGPPPIRVERVPPPPGPGFVWEGGYWRWNGVRYVWVPGRYAHGPRVGAHWVPGHWVHRPGGWVWVEGHWA